MKIYTTGSRHAGNGEQSKRIALFGLFGWGNLGNACTLQAILLCIREHLSDADISCVCANPEAITLRYQIPATTVDLTPSRTEIRSSNLWLRIFNKLIVRSLVEPFLWVKTANYLRRIDVLVVSGTGILDDFGVSPYQMPYDLFKWSLIAKICRAKLFFVSVGAGPIHHPVSRLLMKSALALADYRSYRDELSCEYMQSIGFDTKSDRVYPDLVFSLPKSILPKNRPIDRQPTIIGVGVMAYYGWEDSARQGRGIYESYIKKMVGFAAWLLQERYIVRLLVGDSSNDKQAVADIDQAIQQGADYDASRLITNVAESVEELFEQIATTDLVVATRFHNVIFSLMLHKPVISIGYAAKNDVLMAEMGLDDYCQHIEQLDVELLKQQFANMVENYHSYVHRIERKNQEYRQALDEQYAHIFHE